MILTDLSNAIRKLLEKISFHKHFTLFNYETVIKKVIKSFIQPAPDLAICDFFLWGYLKQTIWNVQRDQQPRNLRELREAIVSACESLGQEMIQNAFDGMIYRAQRCILAQGHAFPDE